MKLETDTELTHEVADNTLVINKLKGHLTHLYPITLFDQDYDLMEMIESNSEFVADLIRTAHSAITNPATPLTSRIIDHRYYSNLRLLYEKAIRMEDSFFESESDELLSMLVQIDGIIDIVNSVYKLIGNFERKIFNFFISEDREGSSLKIDGIEIPIRRLIYGQFMVSEGDDRYEVELSEQQHTLIEEYFEKIKAEFGLSALTLSEVMRIARLIVLNRATLGDALLLIEKTFDEKS